MFQRNQKGDGFELRTLALSVIVGAAVVLSPAAALAADEEMGTSAAVGAASGFATLLYAPVKITYAVGGLLVGGLAWAFSGGDSNVAKIVLTPSVLGDYVVTPKQIRGEETIEFFGRDPKYASRKVDVAASPAGSGGAW